MRSSAACLGATKQAQNWRWTFCGKHAQVGPGRWAAMPHQRAQEPGSGNLLSKLWFLTIFTCVHTNNNNKNKTKKSWILVRNVPASAFWTYGGFAQHSLPLSFKRPREITLIYLPLLLPILQQRHLRHSRALTFQINQSTFCDQLKESYWFHRFLSAATI